MEHRRLGRSGLQVSVLSFGSWVSFGSQLDVGKARGEQRLEGAVESGQHRLDDGGIVAGARFVVARGEGVAGGLDLLVGEARGRAHEAAHEAVPQLLRSEEHTSELQSLMRISYAVFCLKKKKTEPNNKLTNHQ